MDDDHSLAMREQVVRCFEDDDVIHVAGKVDPVADIDVINFELALADIGQLEKRQERLVKGRVKSREEEASQQVPPRRCVWHHSFLCALC